MRVLSRADAISRAKSVLPGIEYDCYLNFQKGASFHGTVRAKFALANLENVFIDYSGKEISSFRVNDNEPVTDQTQIGEIWKLGKLHLDPQWLHKGQNTLVILFKNDYSTDGTGLHTFTDLDQKQYVYTQSEPYYFNKVVPVFDQPDLKGYFRFCVMHPNDWLAISNNEKEVQFSNLQSSMISLDPFLKCQMKCWSDDFSKEESVLSVFNKTKRLPSYLFCLVMGPFACVELPASERYRDIPMAMYYRKSIENFAVPQIKRYFEANKRGIEFYENFFGVDYPFKKLDSAYCPEFSVGAMEYPGIVTYNDNYIYRTDSPSKMQVTRGVRVILHELAHMWYGNLVTMEWWNGLWLNESFAEFMTYTSLSAVQKDFSFETVDGRSMLNKGKNWGYKEDANCTTHPIECDVIDTRKAEGIFDGITYSKGCAVMVQLYNLIGDELFRKNIKNYFEEFKWRNTNLEDLLRHVEKGTQNLDLQVWNNQWLETAGTNTICIEWDASAQGKQTIRIVQGSLLEEHNTLRQHKFDLAFYKGNGEVATTQTVNVLAQAVTEIEIDNQGFQAVLPNANDMTFCSIVLDEKSREYFIEHMARLDELSSLLIVRSLFNDVKMAKVKADVFINILMPVLQSNLESSLLISEFGSYIRSSISYIPHKLRDPFKAKLFDAVWKLAESATDPSILSQLQSLLMSSYSTAENMALLYKAYYKENEVGKKMTFDGRTAANIHYFTLMMPGTDPELKEKIRETILAKADSDEKFRNRKLSMEIFLMSHEEKCTFWKEQVIHPKRTLSYIQLIYSVLGLKNQYNPEESRRHFINEYFKELPGIIENEDKQICETIIYYALPHWEDLPWIIEEFEKVLKKIEHLKNELAEKELLTMIDDYKKYVKAFELYK